MGFNEFLSSIFGNKSTRDMKEITNGIESFVTMGSVILLKH